MNINKISFKLTDMLSFEYLSKTFEIGSSSNSVNIDEIIRYFRGIYGGIDNFKDKFINDWNDNELLQEYMIPYLLENYMKFEPYSFKEAFEISDEVYKAFVFGSIDINDMVESLGHTRIATDGRLVKRKTWDSEGNFTGYVEYDNIYETHKVNGEKIGVDDDLYAVKCWCTSTNKEHWIWIEDQYKNDPLAAIASTFRIHKNVIPYITELKRQGDIMLVETSQDVKPDTSEPAIPLTVDQYFNLLTAES